MPSKNELIVLYAGLALQKLLRDNSQSDADFAGIADRARRAATALTANLESNAPNMFRDDSDPRGLALDAEALDALHAARAEIGRLQAELRDARSGLHTADAPLKPSADDKKGPR